jgi:hypothetical protein
MKYSVLVFDSIIPERINSYKDFYAKASGILPFRALADSDRQPCGHWFAQWQYV